MTTKLHLLNTGTIFSYNAMIWKKGPIDWQNPTKSNPETTPDIVGKHCVKCYPKLGGQFQDQLGKWIPIEEDVTVSP